MKFKQEEVITIGIGNIIWDWKLLNMASVRFSNHGGGKRVKCFEGITTIWLSELLILWANVIYKDLSGYRFNYPLCVWTCMDVEHKYKILQNECWW